MGILKFLLYHDLATMQGHQFLARFGGMIAGIGKQGPAEESIKGEGETCFRKLMMIR